MDASGIAATVVGLVFGLLSIYMGYVLYAKYSIQHRSVNRSTPSSKSKHLISKSANHQYQDVKNPIHDPNVHEDIENRLSNVSEQNDVSSKDRPHDDVPDVSDSKDTRSRQSTYSDVGAGNTEDDYHYENVATNGIIKSGYLYKKSTSLKKDWLRRWFFIKDGKLFYCHVDTDITNMKDIQAVEVANLVISTVKEKDTCVFQIISPGSRGSNKGGGLYELQTETEEEAKEWIAAIRTQIEGSLTQTITSQSKDDVNQNNSLFVVHTSQILDELHQANPYCADCGSNENVTWASLNLCIMICIECSGIHRSLGVHISKVRSLTLDKWSPHNIQLTISLGNKKSNMIWEGSLPENTKITNKSTREERERFITNKYKNKMYLAQAVRKINANSLILKAAASGKIYNLMQAIAAGADVSTTWISGGINTYKTPLHLAVDGGFILCVELLCINNATVNCKDLNGESPLDVAKKRGLREMIELLNYHSH